MNTSPTSSWTIARRVISWCLGIAGVAATAIYLTTTAWVLMKLGGA